MERRNAYGHVDDKPTAGWVILLMPGPVLLTLTVSHGGTPQPQTDTHRLHLDLERFSGNRKVAGSIPGLRLLAKCGGVPEQDTT